jgi:hypothetical protein
LITWIATLWYHAQVLPQFENTEHRMTTQATFNPQAFIELALSRGVLKFGEFTLKSGRVSPYFLMQVYSMTVKHCHYWRLAMLN